MFFRRAWLAQTLEHATLDVRVVCLSPVLGVEITQQYNLSKKKCLFEIKVES